MGYSSIRVSSGDLYEGYGINFKSLVILASLNNRRGPSSLARIKPDGGLNCASDGIQIHIGGKDSLSNHLLIIYEKQGEKIIKKDIKDIVIFFNYKQHHFNLAIPWNCGYGRRSFTEQGRHCITSSCTHGECHKWSLALTNRKLHDFIIEQQR